MSQFDCDVLVVGLGPTGSVLTALLAERGVRVIALDRDAAPYPLPRAVHFDHEIMRIFQQLGVAEQMRHHARELLDYEFRAADGRGADEAAAAARDAIRLGGRLHVPPAEPGRRIARAARCPSERDLATSATGWMALAQDAETA